MRKKNRNKVNVGCASRAIDGQLIILPSTARHADKCGTFFLPGKDMAFQSSMELIQAIVMSPLSWREKWSQFATTVPDILWREFCASGHCFYFCSLTVASLEKWIEFGGCDVCISQHKLGYAVVKNDPQILVFLAHATCFSGSVGALCCVTFTQGVRLTEQPLSGTLLVLWQKETVLLNHALPLKASTCKQCLWLPLTFQWGGQV